jgi:C-terminal processing protease CtpA/Prc
MSSTEWFALMMRVAGATLIGDTTRGSSGNPTTITLANDVTYSVSRWMAYTYDWDVIEVNGIEPDFAIAPESSYDATTDYVLEAAILWLD